MDLQFFRTPSALSLKAFSRFKNKTISRLLDPSGGAGDLVDPVRDSAFYGRRKPPIDVIEIDPERQAILRSKNYRIVGSDFLAFSAGSIYSHILMNPPFLYGAEHVLHALSMLFDGELVAIINAETLRNPCNKKRQQLVHAIATLGGDVEYCNERFINPSNGSSLSIDVAIIHIEKRGHYSARLLDGLRADAGPAPVSADIFDRTDLAPQRDHIRMLVDDFNFAISAMRESVIAEARAALCAARIPRIPGQVERGTPSVEWIACDCSPPYRARLPTSQAAAGT